MDVSENSGTPKIIHFNRVFHYKPSILEYPSFWKHPYVNEYIVRDRFPLNMILLVGFPNWGYNFEIRVSMVVKSILVPIFDSLVVSNHLENISQNGNLPQIW